MVPGKGYCTFARQRKHLPLLVWTARSPGARSGVSDTIDAGVLGRLSIGVDTLGDDGGIIVGWVTGAKVVVVVVVVVVGAGVASVTVGGVEVVEEEGGDVVDVSEAMVVTVVVIGSSVDGVTVASVCEAGGVGDVLEVEGCSGCDDDFVVASWCAPFFWPSSLKHFEHRLLFSGLLYGVSERASKERYTLVSLHVDGMSHGQNGREKKGRSEGELTMRVCLILLFWKWSCLT